MLTELEYIPHLRLLINVILFRLYMNFYTF